MAKTVLLVGHCGPDSGALRRVVKSADPDVKLLAADEAPELTRALEEKIDLILFNRELGYGFEPDLGADMIGRLKKTNPSIPMMLVSNFPDAQAAAVKNGALNGFGKRELGSPRVTEIIRDALGK